jgi:hypothetical protein
MVAAPSYSFMGNLTIHYAIGLVGNLLCLFGALQMWKLKKMGYFIYIAGQVLPIVSSVIYLGDFLFTSLGMTAMLTAIIFPVAFIIMYGINLKHMN